MATPLFVRDVARIWTEERRRQTPGAPAVQESTVWSYHKESWTVRDGRYRTTPMPQAQRAGERVMFWPASQEQALRDWWNTRGRE